MPKNNKNKSGGKGKGKGKGGKSKQDKKNDDQTPTALATTYQEKPTPQEQPTPSSSQNNIRSPPSRDKVINRKNEKNHPTTTAVGPYSIGLNPGTGPPPNSGVVSSGVVSSRGGNSSADDNSGTPTDHDQDNDQRSVSKQSSTKSNDSTIKISPGLPDSLKDAIKKQNENMALYLKQQSEKELNSKGLSSPGSSINPKSPPRVERQFSRPDVDGFDFTQTVLFQAMSPKSQKGPISTEELAARIGELRKAYNYREDPKHAAGAGISMSMTGIGGLDNQNQKDGGLDSPLLMMSPRSSQLHIPSTPTMEDMGFVFGDNSKLDIVIEGGDSNHNHIMEKGGVGGSSGSGAGVTPVDRSSSSSGDNKGPFTKPSKKQQTAASNIVPPVIGIPEHSSSSTSINGSGGGTHPEGGLNLYGDGSKNNTRSNLNNIQGGYNSSSSTTIASRTTPAGVSSISTVPTVPSTMNTGGNNNINSKSNNWALLWSNIFTFSFK